MVGKKILLCVTGGIAVYKAAALTSKLAQAGAVVKVIMTKSACQFVTPLTFQALSRNDVYTDTFDEKHPEKIAHIDLADWADLVLVAPATANIIGKMANGIADDMVTTTILATTAPVWVAPAMNVHMYGHPVVRRNMEMLQSFGYHLIEPGEGHLACGYTGKGRLEEPEKIAARIEDFFRGATKPLFGKTVLVTAGPTIEKIDPVRFLSNRSSGKMGFAIADEAAKMGAKVVLVTSVDNLKAPHGAEVVKAESAADMYEAVMGRYKEADIIIKSAAVADYTPVNVLDKKMKKQPGNIVLELKRTKDILKELGEKADKPFLVGFAAETDNLEKYALDKLERKRADMIVANDVSRQGAGFAGDTNIVTIFKRDGSKRELPLLSKHETAREILREICNEIEKDGGK
ncbi:phosphopantothenoylcysteine decarboxylase [Weizmannia acidilactici]|uniref:Coenzyme A biosynthesis bifunctional protein CoaBC n=1 Tax=Weizmannia acidilactici TaxID=2607726 RepID=A0A5J4JJ76_9BACI|nr:bifunctional phosphopantothenoylcysteine decarboxylase/phosphopantothenate--cysteine ligase CoaBC [Weizmannia acidilactici]GER65572.1 phosphopantothenoylcysteine decarboxylase [Weizmannia acidilactici]GER70417.1 phosphopantothenoylcysteine decarboxylase [Weizmannia acidilactici]GER74112.1 phosphopantothenoylcysteine decarboxylase [Weizmannia acidilactici]